MLNLTQLRREHREDSDQTNVSSTERVDYTEPPRDAQCLRSTINPSKDIHRTRIRSKSSKEIVHDCIKRVVDGTEEWIGGV
jgi:hypothetical protein